MRPVALTLVLGLGWFLAPSGPALAQPVWEAAAPLPTPRSEMRAAVLDGEVIVPGGLGPDRTLDVVEAYRPADGSWRTLPSLPEPVHHAGVAAADGRLFVSGGYRDLRFVPATDLWAYDPAAGGWERLPNLPEPRAGHALVAVDGALYVVGGIGRRSQAVWRFDLAERRWTRPAAEIPTVREHLAAVVLDGRIHVAGGEALRGDRTFEQHEVFDPATGAWRTEAPLVPARHGLASAVADGRWYVIGGATRAGGGTFGSLTDRVSVWQGGR